MRESQISTFKLERYRLGELLPEDKESLEGFLPFDGELRSRLEALDKSDRELRSSLPPIYLNIEGRKKVHSKIPKVTVRVSILVAASLLCILMPVVFYLRNTESTAALALAGQGSAAPYQDRAKGTVLSGVELSVFLKGSQKIANQEVALENQAVLGAGDTVQLAYTAPASGSQDGPYGVIFSIDGRSVVTMHYPYRKGQDPILVSGKRTFLDEAYTLDDAPGYEVFVLVVSSQAPDVEAVLSEAQKIASGSDAAKFDAAKFDAAKLIEECCKAAFANYEVDTVTVLKK